MRQRYSILLGLCASLTVSPLVSALTFQTRLENAVWKVDGDVFECRLTQPIQNFGSGVFVRRAGEQPVFQLRAPANVLGAGSARLLAAAPTWQPGRSDIELGIVQLGRSGVLFTSSQGQASRLINGLLDGRSSVVRRSAGEAGQALEVRVLPVSFAKAFDDYLICAAKLLPMNYDQIRQTQVGFPGAALTLDDKARTRLDLILDYLKADPSVNHVELDGHSDNAGNRLANREASRRRALAVADYLKAHGVPEAQIVVRFHGERYPLVKNTSATNRARNRRVSVQLDRVPPTPASTPVPESPATPAAPAATPAATPASAPPHSAAPATVQSSTQSAADAAAAAAAVKRGEKKAD